MEILMTVERTDCETLASETVEHGEYWVRFEYREFELYERFLVFRDRRRCRQVRVRGYERDPSELGGLVERERRHMIAEQQSTWDVEDGPSRSLTFQVRACLNDVRHKMHGRRAAINDFHEAIPEFVDSQRSVHSESGSAAEPDESVREDGDDE